MIRQGWYIHASSFGIDHKTHYVNGMIHHDSEPAIVIKLQLSEFVKAGVLYNLYNSWHNNSKHHREDGPARIWLLDSKAVHQEWHYNGKCLEDIKSQEMFEQWKRLRIFT